MSRGARSHSVHPPAGQRLRGWARRHAYSLLSSLGTLTRHPLATTMTVVVLAIALSLPAALYVSLNNLQMAGDDWRRLDTMTVFLQPGRDAQQAQDMRDTILSWPDVQQVATIDPAQALEDLGRQAGFDGAVAVMRSNPLPWVLEVSPQPIGEAELLELEHRLAGLEGVDSVLVDLRWLRRLDSMLELVRTVVRLLAALFAIAVLFVVGNTIRLDIRNRQEEIEVMTLVGATDSFIRRPFLYTGLWYGLLGGLLAWLIVQAGLFFLTGPVGRLASSYDSSFELIAPGSVEVPVLVVGSGLLGLAGAWLAVRQHLRRINQL